MKSWDINCWRRINTKPSYRVANDVLVNQYMFSFNTHWQQNNQNLSAKWIVNKIQKYTKLKKGHFNWPLMNTVIGISTSRTISLSSSRVKVLGMCKVFEDWGSCGSVGKMGKFFNFYWITILFCECVFMTWSRCERLGFTNFFHLAKQNPLSFSLEYFFALYICWVGLFFFLYTYCRNIWYFIQFPFHWI